MRRMLLPACAAALLAGAAGAETADEFAARVNRELQEVGIETGRAEWVQRTYITPDTDAIASRAGEREQAVYARLIAESKAFDGQPQSADAARTIKLLRISQDAPAPDDPEKRAELAQIETRMVSVYSAGKYCPDGEASCKNFEALAKTMATSRDPAELLETWTGWHAIAKPIRIAAMP